jgi:CBS domain-containing protein
VALPIRGKVAADIMAAPAITVREGSSTLEIIKIFSTENFNRVPGIASSGKLAGIVSRADHIRAQTAPRGYRDESLFRTDEGLDQEPSPRLSVGDRLVVARRFPRHRFHLIRQQGYAHDSTDCRHVVVFRFKAREIPLFPPLTKGERGI